jgi:hypothetical protein
MAAFPADDIKVKGGNLRRFPCRQYCAGPPHGLESGIDFQGD